MTVGELKEYVLQQTEAEFQQQVEEYAALRQWEFMHIRPAMNQVGGWRTPISGALGRGFPDLLLVRGNRLIFAELKAQKGRLTPAQSHCLDVLRNSGNEVYVWRPSDLSSILELLA